MGSCISKCRPKKNNQPLFDALNLVQDKLVISQPPLITTPPLCLSNKISPYPPSPSPSTSSISSFTCLSSNTVNSSVSSASSATSGFGFSSKERLLFSDEFLRSCYKENPHVVRRINSLKTNTLLSPSSAHISRLNSPVSVAVRRQPTPQRVSRSTPQKRVRSASPTPTTNLTRQKSFKRDQPIEMMKPNTNSHAYSLSNRVSMSPSPSRRFSGKDGNDRKRMVGFKTNEIGSVSLSTRKENAGSSVNNSSKPRACSMKKETCIHRISSKIDEVAVGDAISNHDLDSVIPMEDIDNPLISLDCFIFI